MLASHLRIAALLAELDDPLLAPARRAEIEAALAAEITAHWQADEVRSRRPRVVDEIRNGHWFFEQSLIDASEQLLADYRRAASRRAARRCAGAPGSAATPTATRTRAARRSARRSSAPEAAPSRATATRCARSRRRSASRRA